VLGGGSLVEAWYAGVRAALDHVRKAGFSRVAVVGLRLGSLVAINALATEELAALVCWAPVWSGRRYARELLLIAQTKVEAAGPRGEVPAEVSGTDPDCQLSRTVTVGTYEISREVLDSIKRLSPVSRSAPVEGVLVIDDPDRAGDEVPDPATLCTERVETVVMADIGRWLYARSDRSHVPRTSIGRIVSFVAAGRAVERTGNVARPSPVDEHVVVHHGVTVTERFVTLGDSGLVGVLAGPQHASGDGAMVALIASSVGPGRAFVEFARDAAAAGRISLRFDFGGWGASRHHAGQGWGEYYSGSAADDVEAALDWMAARGHSHIGLVGFCAGAVAATLARPRAELACVVAVNVQLYVAGAGWRTSDGEHGPRLLRLVERFDHRGIARELRRRFWERLPRRSPAIRRLRRLSEAGTKIVLQFDDDDPGLHYFRRHLAGAVARPPLQSQVDVLVYPGLGHLLDGSSARSMLVCDLHHMFESVPTPGGS
jgi:dienelactone hydrolase